MYTGQIKYLAIKYKVQKNEFECFRNGVIFNDLDNNKISVWITSNGIFAEIIGKDIYEYQLVDTCGFEDGTSRDVVNWLLGDDASP